MVLYPLVGVQRNCQIISLVWNFSERGFGKDDIIDLYNKSICKMVKINPVFYRLHTCIAIRKPLKS